jgi:methionyl aminopeptidase
MTIESTADLDGMRAVGQLVARAIEEMRRALEPGITTKALDGVGERFLRKCGARSAPQLTYNFPGFTCISVNDEIVHGVPDDRVMQPGDVVKIDVTAELDGYIADAAITAIIPPASAAAERLIQSAQSAFARGVEAAAAGARISALGRAVENEVQRWGYAVIHEMCGHGVGRRMHEQPSVPNFFSPMTPGRLLPGLVIALEPIIAESPSSVYEDDDGWTLRTANGCLAAHYEHTILIHDAGAEVLTAI